MSENRKKEHVRRNILIILLVGLIGMATYSLGWSSQFTVKKVVVLGAPSAAETEIIQRSVRKGDSLARIEPRSVTRSLGKFTWLDHSKMGRNWFTGVVTIQVWTRTPIARADGHLIDSSNHVFDLPAFNSSILPRLEFQDRRSREFAVTLLKVLPTDITSNLVLLKTNGSHSATLSVKISSPGKSRILEILWGDLSEPVLKVRVYKALISLKENVGVTFVDVSAPHAPIVR